MTVPPKFRGRLSGLCGNFNGDKIDDFRGKNHKSYTAVQDFGDAWRVGGLRACSILPKDMPLSHEPQCKQSWSDRIESDRFCNALKSSLFEKCAGIVDPGYYFDQCKFDMCECPNDQCHCEVLTAYARECELAGQFIGDWREPTGCRNVTSFKYGAHLSSPNKPLVHRNDVIPRRRTSTPITTTTTTISTTTTAKPTTLPAWILSPKSSRLGHALPGCSRKTAKYCQNGRQNNGRKRKLSRAERRRRRRKQKRRERKWRKRQKKLRRQRQNRKRKHHRKNRQNKVFQLGGVALNIDESSPQKRRLQWSSLFSGSGKGRPPFEALLNSAPEPQETLSNSAKNTTSSIDSTNEYEEDYLDFDPTPYQGISSSDLYQIPRNGRKRTPLPLKETTEEWERRKRK